MTSSRRITTNVRHILMWAGFNVEHVSTRTVGPNENQYTYIQCDEDTDISQLAGALREVYRDGVIVSYSYTRNLITMAWKGPNG